MDKILRCDSCTELVRLETLHNLGCCDNCGNKRVRDVKIIRDDEIQKIKDWGLSSFLDKYEEVENS